MRSTDNNGKLYAALTDPIKALVSRFGEITPDRRKLLNDLAGFIKANQEKGESSNLLFVCTHNSRRSHLAQTWAYAAARYYGVSDIGCYSGGTEVTAVNQRIISSLKDVGFRIERTAPGSNPEYLLTCAENADPLVLFSKRFDAPNNPPKGFAAVMTCSEADRACPNVPGAAIRISLPYEDPGLHDGTSDEKAKYESSLRLIGAEMLYAMSLVAG